MTLSTAHLPGVGSIVDPQLADYQASIRFMEHRFMLRDFCDRLKATARRLEWAPRRLRRPFKGACDGRR